jgi:hypothetical protein
MSENFLSGEVRTVPLCVADTDVSADAAKITISADVVETTFSVGVAETIVSADVAVDDVSVFYQISNAYTAIIKMLVGVLLRQICRGADKFLAFSIFLLSAQTKMFSWMD